MSLNLADLLEVVCDVFPERTAVVCDDDRVTYAELDQRANQFGHYLQSIGVQPGQHIGVHMLNSVEFLTVMIGCFKVRAVPVNVNYRYTDHELQYLYDNADLVALVVGEEFAPLAAKVLPDVPQLKHIIVLEDDSKAMQRGIAWPADVTADTYANLVSAQSSERDGFSERSEDDHYVLYTGGTTGMPKGVVWRMGDFFYAALGGGVAFGEPRTSLEEVKKGAEEAGELNYLLTMPLMHGAACYTTFIGLLNGAKIVLMRRFHPRRAWELVAEEGCHIIAVVGDAIGRPLADELVKGLGDLDISSLFVIGSGGAIFSKPTREQLLSVLPNLMLRDGFGASESGTDGELTVDDEGTLRLSNSPTAVVVNENMEPISPGSDDIGYLARSGHVPLKYYKDPEKTAETFPVINGTRWSLLGDMAKVEEDGTIVVLGRGSGCINTGGEKVFPEEVESVIKAHPAVMDVLVAGVFDTRFGERVGAVIQLRKGVEATVDDIRDHVREQLAGYKVPGNVQFVDSVIRSPSGKADYRWAKRALNETL